MLFSFRTRRLPYENKMHAEGTKHARESAAVSDRTKISCIRKVGEPRIRKLSAYEIFWIYSNQEGIEIFPFLWVSCVEGVARDVDCSTKFEAAQAKTS